MVYMFFFRCFVFGQRWGEGEGVGFFVRGEGKKGWGESKAPFFPLEMMVSG